MRVKNKLNRLGISLIECMIVIVIIGVMLLIWRFTSSGHVKIAIANEGHMFVEKIIAQEKIYRASNLTFEKFGATDKNDKININAYDNKYFLTFSVDSAGGGDIRAIAYGGARTKASGITIVGTYIASTNEIVINEHGL